MRQHQPDTSSTIPTTRRRTPALVGGALIALVLSSGAAAATSATPVAAVPAPDAPSRSRDDAVLPLAAPGDISQIALVSSSVSNGYTFDHYRNRAYPCSLSGYQTFTIATAVGSSPVDTRPLWTYMHGGGVGYFTPDGRPADGPET